MTAPPIVEVTPVDPAVHDLVDRHLALARSLACRYTDRGEQLDDLVQVANVGLVKAAQRFDPGKGLQFSTFATATIMGELKRHFRDHRWGLRVSRSLQELFLATRAAIEELTHNLGRSPTIPELAVWVGSTEEKIVEALEVGRSFRLTSIDAGSDADGDAPISSSLGRYEPAYGELDLKAGVGDLIRRLAPREREIVRLRFVEELTQVEIARRIGLSQMQVSRLLTRSLAQLREWAAEDVEALSN